MPEAKRVVYVENGIGYGGAVICLRHLVRHLDPERYLPLVITGRTSPEYEDMANDGPWKHISDRHLDIVDLQKRLGEASWPDRLPGLRMIVGQILARTDDFANFLPFFIQLVITAWRFKADLIHANNEPLCNRAALLAGKMLRIPVVCHVRGEQQGSRSMRWFYSLPDHIIPVSHWISAGVGELGVPQDQRTVTYDGISLETLDIEANGDEFRSAHHIQAGEFAVGLIGLLIPWKGQELFVDVAHHLKNKIPKLKMMIVGGTPEDCEDFEALLRTRVERENLQDIVVFTGHVSGMEKVYNGLDVAVSASTSPEPLGTMVIETMAMGRPLVGPNHGGAAEMADHDISALLFQPGDSNSLAAAIERLYREQGLAARLGHAAREKALQTFSVHRHAAEVQGIYDQVLNLTPDQAA